MAKRDWLAQLGYLGAWLFLAILAAAAAWQLHILLLYFASLLVASPWRPTGWTTGSVATLSRLSIVIWGSAWLILVMYLEYNLRESLREGLLQRRTTRVGIALLLIIAVGYLITS